MTLEQADQIFQAYQELLQEDDKRGARRSPSLLPAPKTTILQAVRMKVARLYYQGLDDEDSLRELIHAAMFIDSFNDEPLDTLGFLKTMQLRRREVVDFYQELFNISRNDRFFWQRVYALIGLSAETKRTTFFEHIKDRLGRVARHPRSPISLPGK